MRAFITPQCNHLVSTRQALCAPLWGVERRGKGVAFPTKTACVTEPTMTASESSPSQGQECDGESGEQIARALLRSRFDSVQAETHEAVVEARSRLRAGDELEDVVAHLEEDLRVALAIVEDAREAVREAEDDE